MSIMFSITYLFKNIIPENGYYCCLECRSPEQSSELFLERVENASRLQRLGWRYPCYLRSNSCSVEHSWIFRGTSQQTLRNQRQMTLFRTESFSLCFLLQRVQKVDHLKNTEVFFKKLNTFYSYLHPLYKTVALFHFCL